MKGFKRTKFGATVQFQVGVPTLTQQQQQLGIQSDTQRQQTVIQLSSIHTSDEGKNDSVINLTGYLLVIVYYEKLLLRQSRKLPHENSSLSHKT